MASADDRAAVTGTASLDEPHFVQAGDAPVFAGEGADDLGCHCGGSTLVRGFQPQTLLGIAIACARCGEVTTTAWLPDGEMPPQGIRVVERNRTPMPSTFALPQGVVLADREAFLRLDALCRPNPVPPAPFELTAATIAEFAAIYDRLSGGDQLGGGQFAAHRDAARPSATDVPPDLSRYPLAWALDRLAAGAGQSDWSCMRDDQDVVATAHLGAFRDFVLAWSRHPLFPAMAAGVAATGFAMHALAVFAAARSLTTSGNRVVLTRPSTAGAPFDGCHIETSPTERMKVAVRRFDGFDWPVGKVVNLAAVRMAATAALTALEGQLTVSQPGFMVLSVGAVRAQDDIVIIEGVAAALRARGRRLPGLAGVAMVLPKLQRAARSDHVGFGWTFLPLANPRGKGIGVQIAAAPRV